MNLSDLKTISGAGLGLRRTHMRPLLDSAENVCDFMEMAPENWLGLGGRYRYFMDQIAERYPLTLHGLSLSLGGDAPLDRSLLNGIRGFMDQYGISLYSEHLSFCSDDGHLYNLLPVPFNEESVRHISGRIRETQDVLGCRIAVENSSYYIVPQGSDMSEADFINAVLAESGCSLLLDVNNVYVNSINHGYDAGEFIDSFAPGAVSYLHIAGHLKESETLIIDTHGEDVCEPVWQLLDQVYRRYGAVPTLLERDFNIPPLEQLMPHLHRIQGCQAGAEEVRL